MTTIPEKSSVEVNIFTNCFDEFFRTICVWTFWREFWLIFQTDLTSFSDELFRRVFCRDFENNLTNIWRVNLTYYFLVHFILIFLWFSRKIDAKLRFLFDEWRTCFDEYFWRFYSNRFDELFYVFLTRYFWKQIDE